MRIALELYDSNYEVETEQDDLSGNEIIGLFERLLVAAGYPPSVITNDEDNGSYQFVKNDEMVVKKEDYAKNQSNQATTKGGIY